MDLTWIPSTPYSGTPPNAVFAGNDSDGAAIFVGRAYHEGDLIPAKVIPSKNVAFVSYDGAEIPKHNFDILCGNNFTWITSYSGNVPPYAVAGGHTASGEPLYVGRGHYNGSLTPGKVHPSHGCLYLPYGGSENKLTTYEVLIRNQPPIWGSAPPHPVVCPIQPIQPCQPGFNVQTNFQTWISHQDGAGIPPNAVFAGQDSDGSPIYVGRATHNGDLIPAKILPHRNIAYVSYNGMEVAKSMYEILAGSGYTWVSSANGHVPPNPVEGGRTRDGEPLYIGRANWNGSLTPGKIHPSHQCLYFPYGGREERVTHYEALVMSKY